MRDADNLIKILLEEGNKNILSVSCSEKAARNLCGRVAGLLNDAGFLISQRENQIEFNGKIIKFISNEKDFKGVHSDFVFYD